MSKQLKIALFQLDSQWENPEENCRRVTDWIEQGRAGEADLVVLPEMFATGFSMDPSSIAQPMDGYIVRTMQALAVRAGKAIICSVAIRDRARGAAEDNIESSRSAFFNRLFFFTPDGVYLTYDKRHLFRMAGEDEFYVGGRGRLVVHYKGFRICPMVCYDLRFPVWSRNKNDYDVLVYIASWPAVRSYAWTTLLRARAIENLAYVVGVNRVGTDPKESYSGDSVVLSYLGEPLVAAEPSSEEIVVTTLELEPLDQFRRKFPAHLDADKFEILPE